MITLLVSQLGISGLLPGLALAVVLRGGFPVVLLAGSVFHEHVLLVLAAPHAGDWLLKLLVITVITASWR